MKNTVITDIKLYNQKVQEAMGKRIRKIREFRGLKASQVAFALDYETTSPISKIENGTLKLNIERFFELSQILGVSTDYLLFGDDFAKGYEDIIEKMEDLDIMELEIINDFFGAVIEKFREEDAQ